MGMRPVELVEGEWYHCYSRTVDRAESFRDKGDYHRFLEAMYLANSSTAINRSAFKHFTHERVLAIKRGKPLVSLAAYALMPNHYHFLIRQETGDGISQFMHRLGTSYSMYFNLKYQRVGNLFVRPFRARHIDDDRYLQRVAAYIHLNPLDVVLPGWQRCSPSQISTLTGKLLQFPYSSLPEHSGSIMRPETALLVKLDSLPVIPTDPHKLERLLSEAAVYYSEVDF